MSLTESIKLFEHAKLSIWNDKYETIKQAVGLGGRQIDVRKKSLWG